jgi:LytS/YehU family sensor histidine kinase
MVQPVFASAWFQIFSLSIVFLGILYLVKWNIQHVRHKEKMGEDVSRKILELEKRALQAQMNPHFIYNAMNSIQQFMILHDVEGAMKYLTRFSRILRTVMNISGQSRISLQDEIKLIEDYLELEAMRFPDKFTYHISVAPGINVCEIRIPPFFIHPQVENAIRHGLLRKPTLGHLQLDFSMEGRFLRISIEDNGIGRHAAQQILQHGSTLHAGKGLAIVRERLAHQYPGNGFKPFRIIDLYDHANQAAGTRVEVTLPVE